MDPQTTIVVTGIGIISPYGIGVDALFNGLLAGKSALLHTRDIFPGFEGSVAAIGEIPATTDPSPRYSRSDRLAMIAAENAIAGFNSKLRNSEAFRSAGIVMASTVAGICEIDPTISKSPTAWYRAGNLKRASSYSTARVAASVGEHLGIVGPTCGVSVACASGAMAIAIAANMLLDEIAPMVLAGGSEALCSFTLSGFNALQSLDKEPCRPFDISRRGLNIGESAAVLVMETLATAQARGANILAVLRGYAMTNDASHPTAPQKQGLGLAHGIDLALKMANVTVDDVAYVNAHGTGTPLNDIAEANAYELAFQARCKPVAISSTKSYFGHCLGSAGSIEAAIAIATIRSGAILPTLRLTNPIESTKIDWVKDAVLHQPVPLALSTSVGFGGSNAVLLFGEYAQHESVTA